MTTMVDMIAKTKFVPAQASGMISWECLFFKTFLRATPEITHFVIDALMLFTDQR